MMMATATEKVTPLKNYAETVDTNPATGDEVGRVANTDMQQFPEIVQKSRDAQKYWAQQSFKQRAEHILKMRRYIIDHADELAQVISESNGKTRVDAMAAEVLPCAMSCGWYAKKAPKVLKPKRRGMGSILFFSKLTRIEHVPVGVVGIISPWNYPLSIPFGEVVMGLMAGNSIILKTADVTSQVGVQIEKIVAAGGLPENLFQMVYARGSAVSSGMLENGVNKIFFTGSVPAGKMIMAAAAQTLTPLSLELGGNDPMIVLDDAEIERTVNGTIWAGFQNSGQSCGGVERVYVQEGIYDEYMAALTKKVSALRQGVASSAHDVDLGCMTTDKQCDLVKEHVQDAVQRGASIVAQSKAVGDLNDKVFHPATVLENCTHDMLTMREETFGPVVAVMKFKTIEEAIALANDSDLALTSSVWSKDTKLAKQIASRLESGVTTINDHLQTHGMSETPWGGWKQSGLGRTHGDEGLKEMTHEKVVNWDWLGARRNLWWHPHDKATYEALKSAMHFAFPSSLADWLHGTLKLTPTLLRKSITKWKPK